MRQAGVGGIRAIPEGLGAVAPRHYTSFFYKLQGFMPLAQSVRAQSAIIFIANSSALGRIVDLISG
jgi:hypothetical protein